MSLPHYASESDKLPPRIGAMVGVGSAAIAFIGFFFVGAFVLSLARADAFDAVGGVYAIITGLVGVWLLKTPRCRGFAVGILYAVACYLLLMMLAGDFSHGFWK
jgi:hypothetical protein